jgi:hypothetical protein
MVVALVEDPALALRAALELLPIGEPVPPEDEAELARREAEVRAGMPMRSHAHVTKAVEEQRRHG